MGNGPGYIESKPSDEAIDGALYGPGHRREHRRQGCVPFPGAGRRAVVGGR